MSQNQLQEVIQGCPYSPQQMNYIVNVLDPLLRPMMQDVIHADPCPEDKLGLINFLISWLRARAAASSTEAQVLARASTLDAGGATAPLAALWRERNSAASEGIGKDMRRDSTKALMKGMKLERLNSLLKESHRRVKEALEREASLEPAQAMQVLQEAFNDVKALRDEVEFDSELPPRAYDRAIDALTSHLHNLRGSLMARQQAPSSAAATGSSASASGEVAGQGAPVG